MKSDNNIQRKANKWKKRKFFSGYWSLEAGFWYTATSSNKQPEISNFFNDDWNKKNALRLKKTGNFWYEKKYFYFCGG